MHAALDRADGEAQRLGEPMMLRKLLRLLFARKVKANAPALIQSVEDLAPFIQERHPVAIEKLIERYPREAAAREGCSHGVLFGFVGAVTATEANILATSEAARLHAAVTPIFPYDNCGDPRCPYCGKTTCCACWR